MPSADGYTWTRGFSGAGVGATVCTAGSFCLDRADMAKKVAIAPSGTLGVGRDDKVLVPHLPGFRQSLLLLANAKAKEAGGTEVIPNGSRVCQAIPRR